MRLRLAGLTLAGMALLLSGCGSSKSKPAVKHRPIAKSIRAPGVPESSIAVIEGWANALREGHPQRAAALWALPSVLINGPDEQGKYTVLRIETRQEAIAADEMLPCGATLRSVSHAGDFIKANFTLGRRVGVAASSDCSGPASVDFLIRSGKILHWLRVPLTANGEPASEAPGATTV